jgi:hypothetical protein
VLLTLAFADDTTFEPARRYDVEDAHLTGGMNRTSQGYFDAVRQICRHLPSHARTLAAIAGPARAAGPAWCRCLTSPRRWP